MVHFVSYEQFKALRDQLQAQKLGDADEAEATTTQVNAQQHAEHGMTDHDTTRPDSPDSQWSSISAPMEHDDQQVHTPDSIHSKEPDLDAKTSFKDNNMEQNPPEDEDIPSIVKLPTELLDLIVQHLEPHHIAHLSATCKRIREYTASDYLWQKIVQRNVPGVEVKTPGPLSSFRELYATHNRLWFLTRHKIWFSDSRATGKVVIVRYDPKRAVIEGYQVVADKEEPTYERWDVDNDVEINFFRPHTTLHMDRPILQFRPGEGGARRFGARAYNDEIPIPLDERDAGICSNFVHARALDAKDDRADSFYPYSGVWPPPHVPAVERIAGLHFGRGLGSLRPEDRPTCQAEESQYAFRIKRWMEMRGAMSSPLAEGGDGSISSRLNWMSRMHAMQQGIPLDQMRMRTSTNVHLGEDVSAFATLDPELYTPSEDFPFRGIWVGDYSGHGPEFLVILQTPDTKSDGQLGLAQEEGETDEQFKKRRAEVRRYRGKLQAIKLTGDPNVPRGECTFYADDLGPDGCEGTVDSRQLGGDGHEPVRVIKSKGHIARTGFYGDSYIDSRLILVNHNRLAQYWLRFGHISFFERVDIDKFLKL